MKGHVNFYCVIVATVRKSELRWPRDDVETKVTDVAENLDAAKAAFRRVRARELRRHGGAKVIYELRDKRVDIQPLDSDVMFVISIVSQTARFQLTFGGKQNV